MHMAMQCTVRNARRGILGLMGVLAAATVSAGPAMAEDLKVVTAIKPLQLIASAVMDGAGTPSVIVKGLASPHGYALRPSDASDLSNADVVFRIGPGMDDFLNDVESSLADGAVVLRMDQVAGVVLDIEDSEEDDHHDHAHDDHGHDHGHDDHAHDDHGHDHAHDDHAHDDHKHDDHAHEDHGHDHAHDDHAHDDHGHDHAHDDHKHDDHAHEDHGHDHAHDDHKHDDHAHDDHAHDHAHDHHGHSHGAPGQDLHVWLDPLNGAVMGEAMAAELAKLDPDNASLYTANAAQLRAELEAFHTDARAAFEPLQDQAILVFHDAYRHLTRSIGVPIVGSVVVNPEVPPSAGRLAEIRDQASDVQAQCLFTEPQFSKRVAETVAEGSDMRLGELDPLGVDLPLGPGQYTAFLQGMTDSVLTCLTHSG